MASPTRARAAAPARQHRGYASELRAFCQRQHLLGYTAPLSDVLVEPRFLQAAPLIAPIEVNLTRSVLFSVPVVPEYPMLHAGYHVPTHSLEEIGLGDRHVAILGTRGSGLSTTLHALALFSLGAVQFVTPPDVMQEQIAAEEKKLSAEERAERVRQNVLRAEQTRESLTNSQGKKYIDLMTAETVDATSYSLRTAAPLLVHLANIVLDSPEYGSVVDPAEPLVRALQSQVGYVTAQTMPPTLYQLLERGQALILLDGLEDIPAAERSAKLGWVRALLGQYGDNRIIMVAHPAGALELRSIGFSTVQLRPWNQTMHETFLEKVAQHAPRVSALTGETRDQWLKQARRRETRDTVLSLLHPAASHPAEAALLHLKTLLADFEAREEELRQLAWMQLEQQSIRIDSLIEANPEPIETEELKAQIQRRLQAVRKQRAALEKLVKAQVLVRIRGGHYRFANALYLAALVAPTLTPEEAMEKRNDPDWEVVLTCANGWHDLQPLVADSLNHPAYIDMRQLLKPVTWLPYASSVGWRTPYLRLLAGQMVAPNQYTAVREMLAAALISSQDASVINVFRKMIQNENSDCRRIGILALGALKDTEALSTIAGQMNEDSAGDVQVAAALALAALATDQAAEMLIIALNEHPSADVQRAAAESLSAFPVLGYPALYAGMHSEEMSVRRAAVWGLGRVRSDWALIALNEALMEDREVFVKLAVQQVYIDSYEADSLGIHAYPDIPGIEWLQQWAQKAIRNNIIPDVQEDIPLLIAAIQQKQDLEARLRCIVLAGQLGFLWTSDRLYKALYDPQEAIRDSAFRSLKELGSGWNMRLPAPN